MFQKMWNKARGESFSGASLGFKLFPKIRPNSHLFGKTHGEKSLWAKLHTGYCSVNKTLRKLRIRNSTQGPFCDLCRSDPESKDPATDATLVEEDIEHAFFCPAPKRKNARNLMVNRYCCLGSLIFCFLAFWCGLRNIRFFSHSALWLVNPDRPIPLDFWTPADTRTLGSLRHEHDTKHAPKKPAPVVPWKKWIASKTPNLQQSRKENCRDHEIHSRDFLRLKHLFRHNT